MSSGGFLEALGDLLKFTAKATALVVVHQKTYERGFKDGSDAKGKYSYYFLADPDIRESYERGYNDGLQASSAKAIRELKE